MKVSLIYDLESDGLYEDVTKIHCAVAYRVETNNTVGFSSKTLENTFGNIDQFVGVYQKADVLIGHNIVNYDNPVIYKLYGISPKEGCKIYDTYLISHLLFPDMFDYDMSNHRDVVPKNLWGSHSLKAWGYRLGIYKGDFGEDDDWSTLSQEMFDYNFQDVEVTKALWERFLRIGLPQEETIDLETKFAQICSIQEKHGVLFNTEAAQMLHIQLLEEIETIDQELVKQFKPLKTWVTKPELKNRLKKDGSLTANALRHKEQGYHYNDKKEYGCYEMVEFKPSSRQSCIRWLTEVYNWKPEKFTEKGNPIIDDSVLDDLDYPETDLLKKRFKAVKILGYISEGKSSWLKLVNPTTNRIHGRVKTLGAVTRRCTHASPNLAQIPSAGNYMGKECRSLFYVPKGKKLVGADADALELRALAHYMHAYDGGAFGEAVHSGDKSQGTDAHTMNQKAAGLSTRDEAKTFIYAFLYGAGDAKIGKIIQGGEKEGKKLKQRMFKNMPALKQLIEAVQHKVKHHGYINAVDGNPLTVRKQHAALNTLLQSFGAICCKYWLIKAYEIIASKYTSEQFCFVLNVHDEVQCECDEDIAEDIAKILTTEAAEAVTERFNLNIPFVANADIGDNWKETH